MSADVTTVAYQFAAEFHLELSWAILLVGPTGASEIEDSISVFRALL